MKDEEGEEGKKNKQLAANSRRWLPFQTFYWQPNIEPTNTARRLFSTVDLVAIKRCRVLPTQRINPQKYTN